MSYNSRTHLYLTQVKRENDQRFGELGLEQTVAVQAQGSLAPQKLYDVVHRQLPTRFAV